MTVRVLAVGRHARQLKANQADDARRCVGQVVEGIGGDGDRAGDKARGKLEYEHYHVADNADYAREPAVCGSHLDGVGRGVVRDKFFYEKIGHFDLRLSRRAGDFAFGTVIFYAAARRR